MPLLQNHIAVVTGAASGIGRAIALGYAREGAQVALLDLNETAAEEAAQEIRRSGGQAESFKQAWRARQCDRPRADRNAAECQRARQRSGTGEDLPRPHAAGTRRQT
jgi:NAD(P)-dependent dehydrogenase (short-subunit alcohol dehydrogenase family)